jgi:YD repeat-containing protein
MNTLTMKLAMAAVGGCCLAGSVLADGIDEPIPSFYQEPGISRTRDYVNQHGNERIDPYTGKLQWHFVDLFIPGNGGMDLKVQRSYNSQNEDLPEMAPGGLGWTMHFGRVIRKATVGICDFNQPATRAPVFELPDGSRRILYTALDGLSLISTDFWRGECSLVAPGGLNVFSPDGTRYEMNSFGHSFGTPANTQNTYYVSRITDRNGNSMSISYAFLPNGIYAVTGVTTSDGRSLTFTYQNSAIATVTDGSRTWTYVEASNPGLLGYTFLKEVQRPDGTKWQYEYNETSTGIPGGYSMRRIVYPSGGAIDYTYDFVFFAQNPSIPRSTVVKQKVASPGGTWNWTYTPATVPVTVNPDGSFDFQVPPTAAQAPTVDQTAVVGPDESTTFYHFGYNSAVSGFAYLIGFALGNSKPVQNEVFAATPMVISNQVNVRPGGTLVADGVTAAILMSFRAVGRAGESFLYAYGDFDEFGNPRIVQEQGTNVRQTNITYFTNPAKWIVRGFRQSETLIDDAGESLAMTRTLDSNANVLSETRAGVTTTFTYTAEGDIATRTNARNRTWSYSNYIRGIAQNETQPEGVSISRVVSNAGNITSETDGELATTGFAYDALNRVTAITHALGNPVTVVWTPTSRTITRGLYREALTYDGFGRETRVTHTDTGSSESIVQNYQVDSLGRRVFASYANSSIGTKFTYDQVGRLLLAQNEFNPASSAFTSFRRNTYVFNQIQTLNERGFTYAYVHRSYGDPEKRDLIGVFDPLTGFENTTITRNITGQMTSVVMDGVTRSYGYDSRFFLTSTTDPETGLTVLGRDEVGNMTSRQVGTSGITTYTYDGRNRQTAISYPAGTPSVALTYFRDDKLKSSDNSVARCDYQYDANKNLLNETLTVGPRTFLMQYTYNGNDALATQVYGSGSTVAYNPDAFSRPRQVAPFVTSVAYHPTGQPSAVAYANGVQTNVGLNPRQWPSSLQITKTGNLFNSTYLYDGLGNVTSISDSVDASYNRSMSYDPLDRLAGISGPWGNGVISYDFRGNITGQSFGGLFNLNYTYNPATQRLLSVSGNRSYSFNYDVYGNVIGNGATTFAYNDAQNMRCANCGLPTEILYEYDGKNQRIRQRKAGVDTFFVYGAAGQLLWEETPNVNLKEYIYLGGKQVAVREQLLP